MGFHAPDGAEMTVVALSFLGGRFSPLARKKAMKDYCARFPGSQPVAVGNSYKGD